MDKETWTQMNNAVKNIEKFYMQGYHQFIGEIQGNRSKSFSIQINKEGYTMYAKVGEKWTTLTYVLSDGERVVKKYPTECMTESFDYLDF